MPDQDRIAVRISIGIVAPVIERKLAQSFARRGGEISRGQNLVGVDVLLWQNDGAR